MAKFAYEPLFKLCDPPRPETWMVGLVTGVSKSIVTVPDVPQSVAVPLPPAQFAVTTLLISAPVEVSTPVGEKPTVAPREFISAVGVAFCDTLAPARV